MKTINKPVYQGDKKEDGKKFKFHEMDMGTLGLGIVGLVGCGQYLYPSLFSASIVTAGSTILITSGGLLIGGVVGAVAVSTVVDLFSTDSNSEDSTKKLK